MTKAELITKIAEKAEISKKDADTALNAVIDSITEGLRDGEKIQLIGFGTFEVRERAEHPGVNPRTGERIMIKASKTPAFKAGSALKEAVSD